MRRKPGAGRKRERKPFSEFSEHLGTLIKARREKEGLSLEQLAARLDISHQALSNIETGQTNPDDKRARRTLGRIAKELKDHFNVLWLRESVVSEPEKYLIDIKARVAAGDAVEFFLEGDDADSIEVDPRMIRRKGKYFALRVAGDSMEGVHVLSGDIVIVRSVPKTYQPSRNELVVADIRGEGITLKRWQSNGDETILIPSTEGYEKIRRPAWRVKPVAVVVGVVRLLS